jgi:hypothetical protein
VLATWPHQTSMSEGVGPDDAEGMWKASEEWWSLVEACLKRAPNLALLA